MEHIDISIIILIFNYNKFLKQPLKKEMFVNEIEKPLFPNPNQIVNRDFMNDYDVKLKAWQEAEKKVIFENVLPK